MEYPFKDLLPLDEVLEREGYYKDWTHLDPEVFYSLTQISEYIKTKGYGVDVRLLIAQLAEHFGLKTTQVVYLANLLQQKFDNLEGVTQSFTNDINSLVAQMEADKDAVIANATVDSEVILARGGKPTLGARLDETTAQLAQSEQFMDSRHKTTTYKITDDNVYSAWPQDKVFTHNGSIYLLFNQGAAHNTGDLAPVMRKSTDGGMTWDYTKVIRKNPDTSKYRRGITSWGAGSDGTNFYAIVLYRGSSTEVGNSVHTLVYGDPDDIPENWTEIEIDIQKDGHVPNQFHSFVALPDGSIAFGYNYLSGEVGIAKTFDKGLTWEAHVIATDNEMENQLNLCEATLEYDDTNNVVVGFLRAENINLSMPKFFVSRDNCQTFELFETGITVGQTPIPIKKIGDKYYGFYTTRYDTPKAYLIEADAQEVLLNGPLAFETTFLGNLNYSGSISTASGVGVGSLVSYNGNLYIYYGSENDNGTVDIYQTILNIRQHNKALISSPIPVSKINNKEKSEIVLYGGVNQVIPPTTSTKINYSKIQLDSLNEYDPSTNTITLKESGFYIFNVSIDLGTLTDAQSFLEIRINGRNEKRIAWVNTYNTSSVTVLQGTYFQSFNAGTEIDFRVLTSNETTTRAVNQNNTYLVGYRL